MVYKIGNHVFHSVREGAEFFKVYESTVKYWINKKKVPKSGQKVVILNADNRHTFTSEQTEWLIKNYSSFSRGESALVTAEFNKRFNTNLNYGAIHNKVNRLGIAPKRNLHTYTEEEIKWLFQNYKRDDSNPKALQDITDRFNKRFNTSVDARCLNRFCLDKLSLRLGKGFALNRETVEGNYIRVKTDDYKGNAYGNHRGNRYKHFVEWEKYHGQPLPEDKSVIFLNGDYRDFSKENLYCVDKGIEHAFYRYGVHDAETGLAVVAYLTLHKEIKNKKKELKETRK